MASRSGSSGSGVAAAPAPRRPDGRGNLERQLQRRVGCGASRVSASDMRQLRGPQQQTMAGAGAGPGGLSCTRLLQGTGAMAGKPGRC